VGAANPIVPARRSLRVINLVKLLEFKVDFSPLIDERLFKSGEGKAPRPFNDWDCSEFALIHQSRVKLQNAKGDKTMLRNVNHLKGFAIRATDGEIGTVEQFYFDDETWAIRYLVVNTAGWLAGRLVLVSPMALRQAEWQSKRLDVALTKKQIEDSPSIDTHKPVSRQHEAVYLGYYGYPYYWGGPNLWGLASYPAGLTVQREPVTKAEAAQARAGKESADSHLRSTNEVTGYHIEADDGEIGHVEDFIVDDKTWAIRYLEVDTRNWWPGKKVLVSPQWVDNVSWQDSKVYFDLTRETIQNGPEYIESMPVTREYEKRLYDHYGRSAYWL
jgi:sporulation protein YlmC with PRC-barrel domain